MKEYFPIPEHSSKIKSRLRLGAALAVAGILGYGAASLLTPLPGSPAAASELPVAGESRVVVQNGFADLVESVSPAVVSVRVEQEVEMQPMAFNSPFPRGFNFPEGHPMEKFFRQFQERWGNRGGDNNQGYRNRPRHRTFGQGSGFFISPDGYVVTNHHVIKDGDRIQVILHNGDEHEASLVGVDAKTDLALLKLDLEEPAPYVAFAEEDNLRVGDWVVAVGNPFGLGGTVTSGIVSGRGRDIGAGPYDDFIQIDAPINRGNSGGPTFDLNGRVVGVNSMIFSPTGGNVGIGFAIPASTAEGVIAELMADGAVSRGWLGVRIQPLDEDMADSLGLEETEGAIISEIVPDGPAEAAGLRAGDVILGVDDEEIESPRDLSRLIASLDSEHNSTIHIWRDGEEQEIEVVLDRFPDETELVSLSGEESEENLGLKLEANEKGVRVAMVDPDSEAARKGIYPGDVILAIGTQKVSSPSEFRERIEKAREDDKESVLLLVSREEGQHYVALPLARG